MTLEDFILKIGVQRFCKMFEITDSTVYTWLNYEKCPRPELAWKIIVASSGLVTYDSIYSPYMKRKFDKKTMNVMPLSDVKGQLSFEFQE